MSSDAVLALTVEYPRLWDVIGGQVTARTSQIRAVRREPLALGVLSVTRSFTDWTLSATGAVADLVGTRPPREHPSASGPDPRVMRRLAWLVDVWPALHTKAPDTEKWVARDAQRWLGTITAITGTVDQRGVAYLPNEPCPTCGQRLMLTTRLGQVCVSDTCRTEGDDR